MKYRNLILILFLAAAAACNEHPKHTVIGNKQTDTKNQKLGDRSNGKKKQDKYVQTVNAFNKTIDSLKLEKGMFPVENYINDTTAGDGYKFALFYLNFMAAAKTKDKAKITSMINFPFQTTPRKVKYSKKSGDLEFAGAKDWKGGLLNEKQFDARYNKIFTDEILENIPETRSKDTLGSLPGNEKSDDDYYSQLQALTDKGSDIFMVNIELPIKKRKYGYVYFAFGRINGEYKVLSYLLQ